MCYVFLSPQGNPCVLTDLILHVNYLLVIRDLYTRDQKMIYHVYVIDAISWFNNIKHAVGVHGVWC